MRPGFLLPYRGMRYHRKDFSQSNPPANAKELFNLRHSSLRSIIECTFGILKQRFRILDCYNHFPYRTQVVLVLVCCLLHNFIMDLSPNDEITRRVTRRQHHNSTTRGGNQSNSTTQIRSAREMREDNSDWRDFRDRMANQMWQRDYDLNFE
jgi:DDE superfamily endonuclease